MNTDPYRKTQKKSVYETPSTSPLKLRNNPVESSRKHLHVIADRLGKHTMDKRNVASDRLLAYLTPFIGNPGKDGTLIAFGMTTLHKSSLLQLAYLIGHAVARMVETRSEIIHTQAAL